MLLCLVELRAGIDHDAASTYAAERSSLAEVVTLGLGRAQSLQDSPRRYPGRFFRLRGRCPRQSQPSHTERITCASPSGNSTAHWTSEGGEGDEFDQSSLSLTATTQSKSSFPHPGQILQNGRTFGLRTN